ncbi:MAG: hypothetical protein AB1423_16055, partial [Pseudomonadota bacterium]
QGGIDLDTTVNSLVAHALAAGNINIDETNAITLTDVDTANGSITITAGGAVIATDVQSLTDNDANDISITGTTIQAGFISAGTAAGDVNLTANAGAITNDDGGATPDVVADVLTTNAQGGIDLDTTVNSLVAHAFLAGNINIDETDAITLTDVDTVDGSITITAGGNIVATSVIAGGSGNIFLDTSGGPGSILVDDVQALGNTVEIRATGAVSQDGDATADIQANDLLISSGAGILGIEIDATNLAVNDTSAAGVLINDTAGGLTIANLVGPNLAINGVTTANGQVVIITTSPLIINAPVNAGAAPIFLWAQNADGYIYVNDTVQNAGANDINLIADGVDGTGQSIVMNAATGVILAGQDALLFANTANSGDVVLSQITAGRNIFVMAVNMAVPVGDILDDSDTSGLTSLLAGAGGSVILIANEDIGANTGAGTIPAGYLDIDIINNPGIALAMNPGMDLYLNFINGAMTSALFGGIMPAGLANIGIGVTNNDFTFNDGTFDGIGASSLTVSANNIYLAYDAGNDIDLGGAGNVTLTAGIGVIQDTSATDANVDIIANNLTMNALSGINGNQPGIPDTFLETSVGTLNAHVSGAGNIDILETDAIILTDVDTANGPITIVAGGQVTATDIQSTTDADANDIYIWGTGNVLVGSVTAGTGVNADVEIYAFGGAIVDNNGPALNITANDLTLGAFNGIGSGDALETAADRLQADNTTINNIEVDNTGALILDDIQAWGYAVSNLGNQVIIRASSPLTVNADVIAVGAITLQATEDGADDDDLTVTGAGTDIQSIGGGLITLRAGHDILLNSSGTISTSNDLYLEANYDGGAGGGLINQTNGTINVAGLKATSTGAITLAQAGNDYNTVAADSDWNNNGVSGNIQITDVDEMTVGTVGAISGINSNGGFVRLVSGNNAGVGSSLTIAQPIVATGAIIVLNATDATDAVSQTAAITGGSLLLLGNGLFDLQNAGNDVGTIAANIAGGDLYYRDATGLTVGSVQDPVTLITYNGINTGGNDLYLQTGGALAINQAITAGAGTIELNSGGGVTQAAAITGTNLLLMGTGIFDLRNAGNNVTTIAANVTGDIYYNDADTLTVGSVTDPRPAGAPTNGITTGGNDLYLQTGGALAVNQAITAGAGTIEFNVAAGGVTQTAAITGGSLLLLGNGLFDLQNAGNDVGTIAANIAGGDLYYVDATALTVGTVTDPTPGGAATNGINTNNNDLYLQTVGALAVNQAITAGAGTIELNVTAGGATQAAAITGGSLLLLGNGLFDLQNAGNDVGTIAANIAGGDLYYRDATALTVGTVTDPRPAGAPTNGITTGGNDLYLQTGGALAINQAITTGAGTIELNVTAGGATQAAAITGSNLLLMGTGIFDLRNAGNNVTTIAANVTGDIYYNDADTLTVGSVTDPRPAGAPTNGITTGGNDLYLQTGG